MKTSSRFLIIFGIIITAIVAIAVTLAVTGGNEQVKLLPETSPEGIVQRFLMAVKDLDYVVASRALGASNLRLLFSRIMPNALTPLIVQGTLGIASAILSAAALSFLGLGAEIPKPEWGLMLGEERNSVFNAPHLVFFPGIAIMLTVLSFNLIGDGLRDALDPRLSRVQVK